jgi:hypothetical protein
LSEVLFVYLVILASQQDILLFLPFRAPDFFSKPYLLKSPQNVQRLWDALERSKARDEQPMEQMTTEVAIAQLR